MPYIKQEQRDGLSLLGTLLPIGPGELNYLLTEMCIGYWVNNGRDRYQTFNDIIGALECAKLEMYRRKIAPYEDTKIEENGDVYFDWNAVLQPQAEAGAEAA